MFVSIYKMWTYQTAGRGGGMRESAVKWSGKNEFWSVKSQGISFQTKSGHPVYDKVQRQSTDFPLHYLRH